MQRRDFLKITTPLTGALLLQASLSARALTMTAPLPQVEFQGTLFRGSPGGKIQASHDAGKNWTLHADFGDELPVLGLKTERGGKVRASLGSESGGFDLFLSRNGKAWVTA